MKFTRYLSVLALLLLVGTMAFAQGTTATLGGTVTHDGGPLPGVSVTITSPALQGTRTTVTNENGGYNFPALPPGDYTVTFEMMGLQNVVRTQRVGLATAARVNADMRLSAVAEAITVTAAAPAVLETQQVQTNIEATLIEDLPIGRTLQATTNLAPGVTTSGPNSGLVISGAYSYDSLYLVNGAVTNENVRGQTHNLFIEDAIQETTVMTGGAISAEYGRFTGGVVTAITRSGGNEFSGSFRDSFTNPSWRETSPFGEPDGPDTLNEVYEATLGGRIIRDRLWFFTAGRYYENTGQGLLTRSTIPFVTGDEQTRLELKLTGQIAQKHTLVGSFLDITQDQTNNCFISCLEISNVDTGRSLPNDFMTFQYNGIITDNFLIEANYSEKHFTFEDSGGDFRDVVNGTAGWDGVVTGAFFGAPVFCGVCDPETRDNEGYGLKGTYYLSTGNLGSHNIVGGYEKFSESRLSNNYQSGSNFFINLYTEPWVRTDDGVFRPIFMPGDTIEYWPVLQLSLGSDLATDSFYVNDKWDLNDRLSFNVGARYDINDAVDSAGNTVADDSNFSPRLGVAYDFFGNGRLRGNASFSRYVSHIAETISGGTSAAGRPAYFAWEYQGPALNQDLSMDTRQVMALIFDWFNSVGGLDNEEHLLAVFIPGATSKLEGSLTTPSVDEFQIGLGTELGSRGFLRGDIISREWNDFYTSRIDMTTGRTSVGGDMTVIENSDLFTRKYEALQIQAGYRPHARISIGGNYTLSETTGNSVGETSGSGPVSESISRPEYWDFSWNSPNGLLPTDQEHKLRAWVSADIPTPIGNFNASVLQRLDSGSPYSLAGDIYIRDTDLAALGVGGGVTNPGYAQPPRFVTYFFSDRGEFRWEDLTATDFALNYSLPISAVELFVQAEMFNIFDESAQVSGDTVVQTRRNRADLQAFDPFTTTPVEGVHYAKGPNFGTARSAGHYQAPRSYQFSVGLRF
ncbi:MAG: carboxypeptidase regulatory-like domain-containing protein [Thermoanaerobaculia bacterium]